MASHFSDIGFETKDESEFMQIAQKAYENGHRIEADKGSYIKWQLKSGAELWLQLNDNEEVIGMTPGFLGESSRKVSIIRSITGHEGTLDASFDAWANPIEDDPLSGEYPFNFEVPNFYTLPIFSFPNFTNIQLTAFAHNLSCFDNEKEYYQSDAAQAGAKNDKGQPMTYASKSFIPIGSFNNVSNNREALSVFSGEIKKYEKRINESTNNTFIWMIVETLGGDVDIVADPELINKEPVKGGYIRGNFWLSGKILNK